MASGVPESAELAGGHEPSSNRAAAQPPFADWPETCSADEMAARLVDPGRGALYFKLWNDDLTQVLLGDATWLCTASRNLLHKTKDGEQTLRRELPLLKPAWIWIALHDTSIETCSYRLMPDGRYARQTREETERLRERSERHYGEKRTCGDVIREIYGDSGCTSICCYTDRALDITGAILKHDYMTDGYPEDAPDALVALERLKPKYIVFYAGDEITQLYILQNDGFYRSAYDPVTDILDALHVFGDHSLTAENWEIILRDNEAREKKQQP